MLAAAFGMLAIAVVAGGDGLDAFDGALGSALERLPRWAQETAAVVGRLGDPLPAAVAVSIVAGSLALARRWLEAVAWVVAVAGNGAWTWALKRLISRARPEDDAGLALSATFSFPSAHASGVLVACGMLAFLVAHGRPARVHVAAALVAAVVVAAAGVSRVLSGHHHASDVLASCLSGGAWLALCAAAVVALGRRGERRRGGRSAPVGESLAAA